MKGLIGKKVGMTQVYDATGKIVPVTVIEAGPCVVVDVKTRERDGYCAVQLGYGARKAKNVSKAVAGHCAKAGLTDKLELRVSEGGEHAPAVRVLRADGSFTGLAFHGVPGGHEFTSFVLGLYNAAGPGQPLAEGLRQEILALGETHMKVL